MEIKLTRHAQEKMIDRGITKNEIKNVVGKGQKWFSHADGCWHSKMRGIEVVFEKQDRVAVIVTCFFG